MPFMPTDNFTLLFYSCEQRFHNNSLLEKQSESTLVLKDLHPEQAGEYYCRASGPSGSIKTKPATLNVVGEFSVTENVNNQML